MAIITIDSTGQDVDFIVKDYDSTTDALISFATVNFGSGTDRNRLWTNFNRSSFSRSWLEIVAYVSDILYFYLDQNATQSYLTTATIRSAIKDIAKQFGFTPASATSASVDVTFTFSSAGTVPRGFKLTSFSGAPFYVTSNIVAGSAGDFTGTALQGELKSETLIATGLQNEEFNLIGPNVVVDRSNLNAADRSPIVTVAGNQYTLVSSFLLFNGSDSPVVTDSLGNIIGGGGRVFTLNERSDGTPYLQFGDGIFGRKLNPGETITVSYRSGGGSIGNIEPESIATADSLPYVTSATNFARGSGGADEQSIEQLRDLIPASLRTLDRAVAESDYSDLIVTTFNDVFAASTEVNDTDPGVDLNIYVVPQGSGISKITDNSLLLARINEYIDRRKTVTIQFQILDAFSIDILLSLEVFISSTSSRALVSAAIRSALADYFNLTSGGPSGAGIGFAEEILLKDIYEIVAAVDGVTRAEIKKLSYRPRMAGRVQGLLTEYQTSEVSIFPNVSESEWLAAAAGDVEEVEGTVLFDNDQAENFSYNSSTGVISYDFPVDLSNVGPGDLFRNGPGLQEEIEIQTRGESSGAAEVIKVITKADQQGQQEITEVITVADVSGSLGGRYFLLYDMAGSVAVWYNVASGNVQPSTGANRHLEVAISSGDSAADVATATRTVINGDSQFSCPAPVSATLTITSAAKMDLVDAVDGAAPTGFTITTLQQGLDADTLDGAYFDMDDSVDTVRVWFSVDPIKATGTITIDDYLNVTGDSVTVGSFTVEEGVDWTASVDDDTTAASLRAALASALTGLATVTVNTNVVTVEWDTPGAVGNAIAMSTDDSVNILLSGSTLSGGSGYNPPATPSGGRLLEVEIDQNDSAVDVATALRAAVDADSEFSATRVSNEVTITSSTDGTRVDPSDGALVPTGFTISVVTQGADPNSIDGTYFILNDINGPIAYWYDVDNSGTTEPSHGAPRSVEITTVTTGMTAAQVASETADTIADGVPEISEVICPAGSAGMNNTYFLINSANNTDNYYVWYNVGGGGSDPLVPSRTAIPVAITVSDPASTVAGNTRTAINTVASAHFTASGSGDQVIITNDLGGQADDIDEGTTSGFTFDVTQQGASFSASDLSNVITVIVPDEAQLSDPDAGDTGFTITVTQQGIADDVDFIIRSVDKEASTVTLDEGLTVNPIAGALAGGSIRNGDTSYSSFKVFKKTNLVVTNFSVDSLTDTSYDLSVLTGLGSALDARTIIDNDKIFVPGEYSTGNFYLVDGSGNIWEILDNDSNTLFTSITAVNDAGVTSVSSGTYRIVNKLSGYQIVFNGSIFNVQYNSHNTFYSIGSQFAQIGTIGDKFQLSKLQTNVGKLGIAVDLISFNNSTKRVRLNGSPDLTGINSNSVLIDASGQEFTITGVDDRALPQVFFADSSPSELELTGSGQQSQMTQGFKVTDSDSYAVVTLRLRKSGNILGNLSVRIVGDDGTGLPDVTDVKAISTSVNLADISESYEDVVFTFTNPPTLSPVIQYHILLSGDVGYVSSQQTGSINTYSTAYTYNSLTGEVDYVTPVDLSMVDPGNYFADNDGTLFKILAVDDASDRITVASGSAVVTGSNSEVFVLDSIYMNVDDSTPSYADGEVSRWDGVNWSNSSVGPDQFSVKNVALFSISGPKSILIESNLTPVLGSGATISERYYDDSNEVSFVLGLSNGLTTSATNVNAVGRGTVDSIPNVLVDQYIFRTSSYKDDIINIRLNEIPQLSDSDLEINIFGGVS